MADDSLAGCPIFRAAKGRIFHYFSTPRSNRYKESYSLPCSTRVKCLMIRRLTASRRDLRPPKSSPRVGGRKPRHVPLASLVS